MSTLFWKMNCGHLKTWFCTVIDMFACYLTGNWSLDSDKTFFLSSIYAYEGYKLLGTDIQLLETKLWAFKNLILCSYGHVLWTFHREIKTTITMKLIQSVVYKRKKVFSFLELPYHFLKTNGGRSKSCFCTIMNVFYVLLTRKREQQ